MKDSEYTFNIEVKLKDFTSGLTNPKEKKKSFAESVDEEETDLKKSEETKKLSDSITVSVFTNMLMAMPTVFLGIGIGIVSFFTGIIKKLFAGDGESEEEDSSALTGLSDNIMEPTNTETSLPEEIQLEKPDNTINIDVGSPIVSDGDINAKYDVDYSQHVTFTSNADVVAKHLATLNSQEIDEPIKNWTSSFAISASKEESIVDQKLTEPFVNLNSTLKTVISSKKEVDKLASDIKSYERKIKNKKALNKKRKEREERESSNNVVVGSSGIYNDTTGSVGGTIGKMSIAPGTIIAGAKKTTKKDYFGLGWPTNTWG